MAYILSTGTAMTVAAATGDAGQLGMAAGFKGRLPGFISLLFCPTHGLRGGDLSPGDGAGGDLVKGDRVKGDRLWGDLYLWFRQSPIARGCSASGDRLRRDLLGGRHLHPFFQHSVPQH